MTDPIALEPKAWLYEMAFYIKPSDEQPFKNWKWVVTIEPPPAIPKDGVRNISPLYTRASPPADGRGLAEALEPFSNISLARDTNPSAPDMIEGPDLAITPKDVRRARAALRTPLVSGVNVSQPKPQFPQPEADVPARPGECSEPRSGHDHD